MQSTPVDLHLNHLMPLCGEIIHYTSLRAIWRSILPIGKSSISFRGIQRNFSALAAEIRCAAKGMHRNAEVAVAMLHDAQCLTALDL